MEEPTRTLRPLGTGLTEREYVEFWPAGTIATGRFRCTACGNAAVVKHIVPRCLMCGEGLWERDETSSYLEVT